MNGPSFGLAVAILVIVFCCATMQREKREREEAARTNQVYRVIILTNSPTLATPK